MKQTSYFLSLLLCAMFLFSSCSDNASNQNEETTTPNIEAVMHYNAWLEIFGILESLDFLDLKEKALLTEIEDPNYGIHYDIDFGSSYVDGSGNTFTGTLVFKSVTEAMNTIGNEISFEMNFNVNDVGVQGLKLLQKESLNTDPWGCIDGCVLTTSTGVSSTFDGFLTKEFSPDGNVARISGSSSLIYQGTPINVSIVNPLVKQNGCKWFIDGEVDFTESNSTILILNDSCSDIDMDVMNEDNTNVQHLTFIHNLW